MQKVAREPGQAITFSPLGGGDQDLQNIKGQRHPNRGMLGMVTSSSVKTAWMTPLAPPLQHIKMAVEAVWSGRLSSRCGGFITGSLELY